MPPLRALHNSPEANRTYSQTVNSSSSGSIPEPIKLDNSAPSTPHTVDSNQGTDLEGQTKFDYGDEWEPLNDEIIYLDCQGLIENDALSPNNPIRLVDLDSSKPLLQIGSAILEGQYEDAVGTFLFFDISNVATGDATQPQDRTLIVPSPMDTQNITANNGHPLPNSYLYAEKTRKCILFNRVFLKPKESEGNSTVVM